MSEINVPGEESTGSSDTETQKEPNDPMCDPVYQPYYVAFAQAHLLTPEVATKSLPAHSYVIWVNDQWRLWEGITGYVRQNKPNAHVLFRRYLRNKFFPEPVFNINVEIHDGYFVTVDKDIVSRVRIIERNRFSFLAILEEYIAVGNSNEQATENLLRMLHKAGVLK